MLKTVGNPSTRYGDQTIVGGNLVIGTSGNGIDFSAASHAAGMTSELLDDYEEGTFSGDTSSLTTNYTFTSKTGRYTKIGDTVHVWFDYQWTSANTGSGETRFGALPFAATQNGSVFFTHISANIAADQIAGEVVSGTSYFTIYGRNNASAAEVGPAQRTVWGATNRIAGYAVYKA